MSSNTFDVIVIGLGVMGSATAHQLSQNGERVLCLEQFDLGHSRGSSHGHTRIIRKVYTESHFSKIATLSYPLWEQLEQDVGYRVTKKTGGLDWDSSTSGPSQRIIDKAKTVENNNLPYELLTGAEVRERFPGLDLPPESNALFQADSGVAFASKAVRAMQTVADAAGATLRDNIRVESISAGKGDVTVRCSTGESFRARSVVVAPGGWLKPFLSQHFGLNVEAEVWKVGYWYFDTKEHKNYEADSGFPVFIDHSPDAMFYGTPGIEYPNLVKVGAHYPSQRGVTADTRNFIPDRVLEGHTKNWVRKHFPLCDWQSPALAESCLYTVTRNEEFLLDHLPSNPHVVVGGGFSGHGFKHAPMVGKMLAQLAISRSPAADSLVGTSRFGPPELVLTRDEVKNFAFDYHLIDKSVVARL